MESTLSNAPGTSAGTLQLRTISDERFIVEGELARGGLGRILRARDPELGRVVAIKVPLGDSEAARRRFLREALLTARLSHPSIVAVYEAGWWHGGEPFFAMQLVEGRSFKERLAEAGTLDARLALLPHLIAVAEAVAYAHGRGVIHRDLKPSNVLIGRFGETVVIDWGLAKELGSDDDSYDPVLAGTPPSPLLETQTGAVMGTPRYMPPEQAAGQPLDARADVYALGAMLHHLLGGEPPQADGASPSLGGPAELVTIVRKAMARKAADRYASAGELADELRRFATGQLVGAHRYTLGALLARFVRRYAVAVAVGVIALVALGALGAVSVRRISQERRQAESRRDELLLAQARSALQRDPTLAAAWLKQYPLDGSDWPSARALISAAQSGGVARAVLPRIVDARPSADGKLLVTVNVRGLVEMHDLAAGTHTTLGDTGSADTSMQFLPSGEAIAVNSDALWRCPASGCTARWKRGDKPGLAGSFLSKDSRFIVASTVDNGIRIFELDGDGVREYPRQTGFLHDFALSADDKWLAYAGSARVVSLCDRALGTCRELAGHTDYVRAIVFAPDGKTFATSGHDGTVRIWDVDSGTGRVLGSHKGPVFNLGWSPDGKWIASASGDRTIRLWPVAGGEPKVLSGHTETVLRLAFSPDGAWLASGGEDQTVRLWSLSDEDTRILRGHQGPILHLTWSQDSKTLVSRSFDSEARVWQVGSRAGRILGGGNGDVLRLQVARDGRLALVGWDGTVSSCDNPDAAAQHCTTLTRFTTRALGLAFSPDGKRLAASGADGGIRVMSLDGGAVTTLSGHRDAVKMLWFSPDGSELVSASDDGTIRLWTLADGKGEVIIDHHDMAPAVMFSPDGGHIASGGFDHNVRIWDRATRKSRIFAGHATWVIGVAFSPDGRTLASTSFDTTVRLWNVATGQSRVLAGHDLAALSPAFSPDGKLLATSSLDRTVRLWDVATGTGRVVGNHDGLVKRVVFSPDGRTLATACEDRMVRLIDVATGEGRVVGAHQAGVRDVTFSADGMRLISAGNDHLVRIWPLGEGDLPRDPAADRALVGRMTTATLSPAGALSSLPLRR